MQAIIINYFIACAIGFFGYIESSKDILRIPSEKWFPGALMLGALFITVFNLAAITTQRSGLSVVSVATKMPLLFPFSAEFLFIMKVWDF